MRAENLIRSAELGRRTSRRDGVPPWCDRFCTGVTCSGILRIRSQIIDGRFLSLNTFVQVTGRMTFSARTGEIEERESHGPFSPSPPYRRKPRSEDPDEVLGTHKSSLFDHPLDLGGLGYGSASNGPCGWS